jgi:hypothetical protein
VPMTLWVPPADRPLLDDGFPLPLHDPFTLRQALAEGLTQHRIRRLEQEQLIRRMLKSVYVAAQAPDDMLLRAKALALVVPHAAVVTDWTACWFWTGLLPVNAHLAIPPLSVFHPARHARLRNALCDSGARSFRPSDLTTWNTLRLTTPLRTAWDLGRLTHRDRAIGALDALLRHGTFTSAELVDGIDRFKGMRGVVQLRTLAPLADPRSESPGESTLRLRWLDMPSLPRPTPQVPVMVGNVEVYRIDLGVPELRYGCEYNGEEFHSDDAQVLHDRERREDLARRFGWLVEGVRRTNVYGATRDVEELLHQGVRRARRALGLHPSYEP